MIPLTTNVLHLIPILVVGLAAAVLTIVILLMLKSGSKRQ